MKRLATSIHNPGFTGQIAPSAGRGTGETSIPLRHSGHEPRETPQHGCARRVPAANFEGAGARLRFEDLFKQVALKYWPGGAVERAGGDLYSVTGTYCAQATAAADTLRRFLPSGGATKDADVQDAWAMLAPFHHRCAMSGGKLKIQVLEAGHPRVEETAEGAMATLTLELLAREPGVRIYAADDGLTGQEAEAAFRAGAAVRLILGVNTPAPYKPPTHPLHTPYTPPAHPLRLRNTA